MSAVGMAMFSVMGGILGLDTVSFPQAMLSRPIVSATLGGAAMGAPAAGLLAGATLELYALETLPFGASRYPEWGSSSAVGGALFAMQSPGTTGALILSVTMTLALAYVGGWSMVQLRRLNASWARRRHEAVARGSRRVVIGLQLYGLTADLLRGIALTALGLAVGIPAQRAVLDTLQGNAALSRAVVVAAATSVALGAVWKIFHAVPHARWLFAVGLAIGVGLAVSR
ncbi:MAG: PTS sugar transporter subunit IIC [Gemmatimonadaceae bacterium]